MIKTQLDSSAEDNRHVPGTHVPSNVSSERSYAESHASGETSYGDQRNHFNESHGTESETLKGTREPTHIAKLGVAMEMRAWAGVASRHQAEVRQGAASGFFLHPVRASSAPASEEYPCACF